MVVQHTLWNEHRSQGEIPPKLGLWTLLFGNNAVEESGRSFGWLEASVNRDNNHFPSSTRHFESDSNPASCAVLVLKVVSAVLGVPLAWFSQKDPPLHRPGAGRKTESGQPVQRDVDGRTATTCT